MIHLSTFSRNCDSCFSICAYFNKHFSRSCRRCWRRCPHFNIFSKLSDVLKKMRVLQHFSRSCGRCWTCFAYFNVSPKLSEMLKKTDALNIFRNFLPFWHPPSGFLTAASQGLPGNDGIVHPGCLRPEDSGSFGTVYPGSACTVISVSYWSIWYGVLAVAVKMFPGSSNRYHGYISITGEMKLFTRGTTIPYKNDQDDPVHRASCMETARWVLVLWRFTTNNR